LFPSNARWKEFFAKLFGDTFCSIDPDGSARNAHSSKLIFGGESISSDLGEDFSAAEGLRDKLDIRSVVSFSPGEGEELLLCSVLLCSVVDAVEAVLVSGGSIV
jgi:hypothetical protein